VTLTEFTYVRFPVPVKDVFKPSVTCMKCKDTHICRATLGAYADRRLGEQAWEIAKARGDEVFQAKVFGTKDGIRVVRFDPALTDDHRIAVVQVPLQARMEAFTAREDAKP
jgi:hypothetical protein